MNCFYNPSEPALGTCKSCGRGISFNYLTEYPKGLACKNRCEKEVEDLISLIDTNVKMRSVGSTLVKGSASSLYASFLLYLVMAGGFFWMGSGENGLGPIFYMGVGFACFAIYVLVKGLKISMAAKDDAANKVRGPG